MSRESWYSAVQARSEIITRSTDGTLDDASLQRIVQSFRHQPLAGKTGDPEAADCDEAAELFLQGVRLARSGDLEAGCAQIATAFLLDGRSINFLPSADLSSSNNRSSISNDLIQQVKSMCVDIELLFRLFRAEVSDPDHVSYGGHILRLLTATKIGRNPKLGQDMLAVAIKSVNYLIQRVKEQPHLGSHYEQGGVLGGCMNLPLLFFHRSTIYMAMGNHKKAIQDLTKALDRDPACVTARDARASLWATLRLKDYKIVFGEYERIVSEVHPDNRGLEVAYAWMTIYTLQDAGLGTVADAKLYYEKCLRSSIRRSQLYGGTSPPVLDLVKTAYATTMNHPEPRQLRENLDVALATGRLNDLQIPQGFQIAPNNPIGRKLAHACLTCGKTSVNTGKALSKCMECKKVSYCSKECQTKDWKKHKVFCKAAKLKEKDFASTDGLPMEVSPSEFQSLPREPVDEINAGSQVCRRVVNTLKVLSDKYGNGFATWWNGMQADRQYDTLMDVTNGTLPDSYSSKSNESRKQARRVLASGGMSGCCIDLDVDYFRGQCHCPELDQHFFGHRLLHVLHSWTNKTTETEQAELRFCKSMVDSGVFPRIGPPNCFAMPPSEDVDQIQMLQLSDDAPVDYKKKLEAYVASGLMYDVSTLTYAVTRNGRVLALLVGLFDFYQANIRRIPSTNPWERLYGCEHCRQGCESEKESSKCEICTVTWWCCSGCRQASEHGRKCPHGKAMGNTILFHF